MKKEETLADKLFRLAIGGLAIAIGALLVAASISIVASFVIGLAPLVAIAIVAGIISPLKNSYDNC